MFTNHTTVTLFCSKTLGREKLWSKYTLRDVNFHGADQLLVSDKKVKRSEEYIIRVPHSALENYVDKATYKAMPADEAYNCFTLKKGDYIVQGEVDCDISNAADLIKNYDALEIVSVTENLNASNYSKHIKLVVK